MHGGDFKGVIKDQRRKQTFGRRVTVEYPKTFPTCTSSFTRPSSVGITLRVLLDPIPTPLLVRRSTYKRGNFDPVQYTHRDRVEP